MKTVRRLLAFMLAAGLMVSTMAVFASGGYSYSPKPADYDPSTYDFSKGGVVENGSHYSGMYPPSDAKKGMSWMCWDKGEDFYQLTFAFDGSNWVMTGHDPNGIIPTGYIYGGGSGSSGSSDSKSALEKEAEAKAEAEAAKERALQEQASREAVRLAGVASDEGFANVGDMYRAAEKGMSAGEYYNNVVTSTPGIENAVTVGQGGNLVVDGQVTNMSASISKITNRAYVDSVRIDQEGTVLNVVEVSYPAVEATINFYMPSVTADMNITAVKYNAGTWVDVEVAEVRDDHVVLNMKGNGVVAFIAK